MALSARRFIHENTCPEPTNQINCNYHATDVNALCDGTGSTVAIFSNTATLTEIYNDTITDNNIGEGGVCAEGMDVVFLVDYTGSMSGAISGVKTGISNLVSTINTQSGGDYRLSLVLYDERSNSSPVYSSSGYYINLPSNQKINTASPDQSGYNLFFTCVEKMNTVGNSTSFTNALNAIDGVNSSTEMALGSGGDGDEPAGRCIYEIAANGFAGSFRNGVQKLIILITDNETSESASYWQNTLTPELNNAGVQLMVNSTRASTYGNHSTTFQYAVDNTQPAGAAHYQLNYTSTWTTGLETSIENLCEETFTYTCDALPVGWYQETGSLGNTAYYWDGSDWTSTHTCQYTVTINLVNQSSTTTIDNIPSNHAYYTDADTYTITADYGTSFSLTNSVTAIADHTFDDITSTSTVVVSGSGGTISVATDGLLASNEFQITGTVTADMEFNVLIDGTATQTQYSMVLDIIGDETDGSGYTQGDTLDANSQAQSPAGYVRVNAAVPASGWVDVGSTYFRSARRYTFTGVVGSSHSFDVNLTPDPTDYDLTLESTTLTGSQLGAAALSGNYTLSNPNKDLTGTFTMPSGGGSAQIYVYGQVNQPDYTYTLTATDAIIGASIDGAPYSQTFTGYTGDTFDFTIQLSADTDYSSFTIDETLTLSGDDTAAIDYTVDNVNGRVTGTVTMPAGGGDGAIRVSGSATQTQHTYTITFVDPYTDTAAWQDITYTGVTGSAHETSTHPLSFKDGDTNYYITGVSNDDTTNLTSTDNEDTNQSLFIGLASMPQGGGSATVTVTGSQAAVQYTFNTTFTFEPNSLPASNFTSTDSGSNLSIATTGAAGSTHTVQTYIETPIDYEFSAVPGVSESHASLSSPTCAIQSGTASTSALVSVTLTMPSGGGSGTVAISPTVREKSYTYTLTVQTNGSTSSVNQYSEALASPQGDVSGSNNGDGTVTITYGPMPAGNSVNDVMVGVVANNATDYTPEITGFSYSTGLEGLLNLIENEYGTGSEGIKLGFTMPSQDPRSSGLSSGTLTANVSLTAVQHSFTINFTDTIANVTPDATSQTFTGGVGDEVNWSQTYSPSSGYSMNITSVSDDSASVSSQVVPGGQSVSGTLTMPSGGGSATVTAEGTSTLIQYTFTVTFSESISNAAWRANGSNTRTRTVTLAPGNSTTISEWLDTSSGYEFSSTSVSDNSSNISTSVGGLSTDTSLLVNATVSMPSGASSNQSGTVTVTGSTATISRTLTINYSESITGARITSGTSELAAERTTEDVSGGPGTTGSLTRYLMASQPLYTEPVINTITDDSTYITNLASASSTGGSGLYREFTFDYQIPPSDQSGTITIGGSVTVDEDCYTYTASSLNNSSSVCNVVRYWPCGNAASTTTSPIGGGQSCGGSGYTSTSRTFCHSVTRAAMDSSFPGDQPYWSSGGNYPGDSISQGSACN